MGSPCVAPTLAPPKSPEPPEFAGVGMEEAPPMKRRSGIVLAVTERWGEGIEEKELCEGSWRENRPAVAVTPWLWLEFMAAALSLSGVAESLSWYVIAIGSSK